MSRKRRVRRRTTGPRHASLNTPPNPRIWHVGKVVYWVVMAISLLCIVVTRGDDLCLAIVLADGALGVVLGLTGKRGFWD